MSGIGSHTRPSRGQSDDWLTPRWIVEDLGPFDLDPCASIGQPWLTAMVQYTVDGLARSWRGLVWLNPPYGKQTWEWLERLGRHPPGGIALIFARTETQGFVRHVWHKADSLLFLHGRLHFHHPRTGRRADGNAGGPSVLVAYGDEATARLERSRIEGSLVADWR